MFKPRVTRTRYKITYLVITSIERDSECVRERERERERVRERKREKTFDFGPICQKEAERE